MTIFYILLDQYFQLYAYRLSSYQTRIGLRAFIPRPDISAVTRAGLGARGAPEAMPGAPRA